MEIDVTEDGIIRIQKAYNSVVFKSSEGKEIAICEREGSFEIGVIDRDAKEGECEAYWYVLDGDRINPLGFRVAEINLNDN